MIKGNVILKNSQGSLLTSENGPLLVAIGVKDLIIVTTPDTVLVVDKKRTQEVKEIANALNS